jgi:ATP-dependent Lhr-like helicase
MSTPSSHTASFHPAVSEWFHDSLGEPTVPQQHGWPSIHARRHTLIAAPTGSGKTLAAFLCAIDELVRDAVAGLLRDELYVVYVSPLKALSHDIEKNLEAPLSGIGQALARRGEPIPEIRTMVRSGDTPAHQRTAATKRPPHILVTTPESLYILLTSDGGRAMLRSARTVVVDEIHAMVGNKRGSHLALSIERLDALVRAQGRELCRVGLSATQTPIDEVARFLVGARNVDASGTPSCTIIDSGHRRALDLAIEVPSSPIETVVSGEVWEEIHARLAELIEQHKTTLVFVNTRRMAERLTRSLSERLGEDAITSHHGSLSRQHRHDAERRLKNGELRAMVATASLELGIDIGDVELVCQIGSTRTIAAFLQRVGRSGHHLRGVPKGRLFPLSRDELVECAALVDAVRRGELDRLVIPEGPLDILAQQIVAITANESLEEDALFELLHGAWPYRNLPRDTFEQVVRMLSEGFDTSRGRRSAHIHHDAVNRKVRGRRGAKIVAITCGGAIPDVADYEVLLEPTGIRVGSLNEDFAIESMAGDIFQLGNVSYRILRVEPGKVRVEDARGQPPTMPFWLGEAPSRSEELSEAVSRLRMEVAARLEDGALARSWLERDVGISEPAARQVADYIAAAQNALGALPTKTTLVLERFFDEQGGMHLVVHSPLGSRLNRAWGLALRKCFCRKFNFELQAAANEDAIVLSLGPTHSFALEEVWTFLKSASVREILVQALLDAPMFATRWRWNATRALAVKRFRGGKKVPPPIVRMDADDLLTVCFPDKVACLENVVGNREIPDHPLVRQTIDDCLTEAMDADGLVRLVERIEARELTLLCRDVTEPSPLAANILNARPYAFLDDAPLEERRTQAVLSRRWLDPASASDIGALDESAIARVCEESWPEPRDREEMHDALVLYGLFRDDEAVAAGWNTLLAELVAERRVTRSLIGARAVWVAAERIRQVRAVHADIVMDPPIVPPARDDVAMAREAALVELVRGRLECEGPTTIAGLAHTLCVDEGDVELALITLETEGFVLRGRFTSAARSAEVIEWCERRLLARIHRYTVARLRREIEPVSAADFMRFLLEWQHVAPHARLAGAEGMSAVIEQLDGFEVQAAAWESDVLPVRMHDYDPSWLDALCLSGRVTWARRTASGKKNGPVRSTPIALLLRGTMARWLAPVKVLDVVATDGDVEPSAAARVALGVLSQRGACFFDDLMRASKLLKAELEEALGELVSAGLVSSDGISGLRALIAPRAPRSPLRRRAAGYTMEAAGRWAMLVRQDSSDGHEHLEAVARSLLRRWGVLFRRLLDREGPLPPWRDLLRTLRRLEARGEIRGGRFVDGFAGEQFALVEAVGSLRKVRRAGSERTTGEASPLVAISAADPLNLVGIITPGKRVTAIAKNRILLRDGVPIACREGGEIRLLTDVGAMELAGLERALVTRRVPPAIRAYLGNAV